MLSVRLVKQKSVSGNILDQTGRPLIGAIVLVDNINRWITKDFNGDFFFQALKRVTLIVSYAHRVFLLEVIKTTVLLRILIISWKR